MLIYIFFNSDNYEKKYVGLALDILSILLLK